MAEYGAHITVTNEGKPSIFDVVAQETLLESLEPAFKHVMRVLAEKNPSTYGWALIYAEELYLCLHVLLQYHYLSNYGASFAENFYDLKRVPLNKKLKRSKPLSLHPTLVAKSLVTLTIVPYVRNHLNQYVQAIQQERAEVSHNRTTKEKLKTFFVKCWPKIHLTIQLAILFYYIRYLVGKHKVHSPLLHLVGLRLSRLTELDAEYIEERSSRLSYSNIKSLRELGWWVVELIGSGLQNSIEIGAFFLQFLDWFYSSDSSSKQIFAGSSIPPPPHKIDAQIESTKCPICFQQRTQDTALTVSGYVFCYSCILVHVREKGTCPVTLYPASTKQLVKIYTD